MDGCSVYLLSLGCDKNLVDSERMLGILAKRGVLFVTEPSLADLIVVNTCGFIESAVSEAIDHILALSSWKIEWRCKKLVVTGCMVQRYGKKLLSLLPEVDVFFGTNHYKDVGLVLEEGCPRLLISRPCGSDRAEEDRVVSTPKSYAYLKIAEGCQATCGYCLIPRLRGPLRSRSIEDVYEEARKLDAQGITEIVLVAQDVTSYGHDRSDCQALEKLLRRLELLPSVRWIRLLYAYPANIRRELLRIMASSERILPYLDIPFQHVAPHILRAMGRSGTALEPEWVLEMVRSYLPHATVRTTFMVGFPGESEEDFAELLSFVERMEIDHMGAFAFSPEMGTKAAKLSPKVPEKIKRARLRKLYAVQKRVSRRKLARLRGQTVSLIVDGVHPETELLLLGRLPSQAPEVDGSVIITAGYAPVGSIVEATITRTRDYDLEAELVHCGF